MRIEIDGTVIAGAERRESVKNFTIGGGSIIQTSRPLRCKAPKFFDRGGESQEGSFEVQRLHDTIPQAAMFCLEHMGRVSKTGMFSFSEDYDGQRIERKADGALKRTGCRMMGVSTFTTYQFEIGEVKEPKNA